MLLRHEQDRKAVTTGQCDALQGRQLWADVTVSSVMLSLLCSC